MKRIFGKGQEKSKAVTVQAKSLTTLEQICPNDEETYEALSYMFLDPRKIGISFQEAVDNAEKAEEEKDVIRAKTWYEVAGGLAVYEDNTKKAVECYSKAEKLTGMKYPFLNNPDKAVAKAQEYYKQYLGS